jgi:serine/threonine protein kinase
MEADLRDILETSQLTLEDSHIQYFTYQLILALHHLHNADILHRDMKPEVCLFCVYLFFSEYSCQFRLSVENM